MSYILRNSIIFFILITGYINGQTDAINHQKYWYYRTRLTNDFMKIGKEQGESVPFNQRGLNQKGYPSSGNSSNKLYAGDGIASIGSYIAALASEYYLLKINGQTTDSVKHELFCALNAINRLDAIAEPLWDGVSNQIPLNGFMMRDDIDKNFIFRNYEHLNYYNHGVYQDPLTEFYPNNSGIFDKGFCSQMEIGQTQCGSDYITVIRDGFPDDHSMSQDHVITLLIGLSLVNKYVDYSTNDNGAVFPYEGLGISSIKQETWNIVDRIAQHFKNDPHYNLKNPITNQLVHPGGMTNFTQYGLAESFCKSEGFTGGATDPFIPILNNYGSLFPFTCNYNTPYVRATGLPTWELYTTTASTSVDNAGFKSHLLATGDCGWMHGTYNINQQACDWVSTTICNKLPWPFSTICNVVNQFVCNTVPVQVPAYRNKTANLIDLAANGPYHFQDQLKENSPMRYDMWDAPLLYRALFPNNTINYQSYIPPVKTMLDNAPCVGPYNFGQFARPDFEWTCENRIEKTINRQDFNEPDDGWYAYLDAGISNPQNKIHTKGIFKAEYNGVDYMIYHNLYRLTNGSSLTGIQNLSHRYINVTLPIANTICLKPNTCTFRAFETIVADNTINNNGSVDYKAGKIIDLKPGFYVTSGADFHAYIEASNCNNGASGLRTAQDSSKSTHNSFTGYDNMGDDILTHYVS
ncbi:MAG: hypothetical protein HY062_17875 [Bacteroidetes bacterium]|nr:hypothetical protein [Bacteroidota bacterium]